MVKCRLCGKVVRTTQGLRGHKTFIHGIHGNHSKLTLALTPNQSVDETSRLVENDNNNIGDYRHMLNKLKGEVISNAELLVDLKRRVHALQNQLALLATSSDINRITTKVELLNKRVEKHEQWLNPKNIDEIVLGFCGGPIASLEKRLDHLQPIVIPKRQHSA